MEIIWGNRLKAGDYKYIDGSLAIREPGFLPPGNFSPSAFILSTHLRRPAIIAATTRALPSWVFGPVDMPPWNLQRLFPGASQCAAFLRHSTSRIGYRADRKAHVRRSRSVLAPVSSSEPACLHAPVLRTLSAVRGQLDRGGVL